MTQMTRVVECELLNSEVVASDPDQARNVQGLLGSVVTLAKLGFS